MKHVYFEITIPAGSFIVKADSMNGRKLDYLDFFDSALLYRYFKPEDVRERRISPNEARRATRMAPAVSFRDLFKYGEWR